VKKARVDRDSLEEAEVLPRRRLPIAKPKSTPGAGVSGGSGAQVRSGGLGNGGLSEAASLQLMVPLLDMTQSLRRVVQQNMEFLEEFNKAQNTQLDLLANLCSSMREISYQLHLHNVLFERVQVGDCSEVSEQIQQVAKLGEDGNVMENTEIGVQVGPVEVLEDMEMAENAEDVGTENAGNEHETMEMRMRQ
jgi:hypothetical protein